MDSEATIRGVSGRFHNMTVIEEKQSEEEVQAQKQDEDEEDLFEGCGREGPIRAIFLSEFHHIAGPKIVYQYPDDIISKEFFDVVSTYIIPKSHLQRLVMTVNVLGRKVLGYPIQIKNDYYERNAYYFNICFVCDAWARTVQYEPVLVKIAEFFYGLELESNFLSQRQQSVLLFPASQQSIPTGGGDEQTVGSPPSTINSPAILSINIQPQTPPITGCPINTNISPLGPNLSPAVLDSQRRILLQKIFSTVLRGLNSVNRECEIVVEDILVPEVRRLLKLKVVPAVISDPPPVFSCKVPVVSFHLFPYY